MINKQAKYIGIIILLIVTRMALGQEMVSLKVKVDSIRTNKGEVLAAIFESQSDFKKDSALQRKQVKVNGSSVTLEFQLPANRSYSVALFQDIDGNGKLNTKGAMKVPDEPIGFSNNKLSRFGPPDFDKVSFKLTNDTLIQIYIISSRKEYFNKFN